MKKIITAIACGIVLSGCSIYTAVKAPTPVEYKKVQVGSTRPETISVLGFPKMTDTKGDKKIDTFQFFDGYNSASKARIILYLAGDIFTAGLAEIIFWPLEENVFDGKECRGSVTYNADEKVIGYDILDNKGAHLWTSAVPLSPTSPARK